MIASGYPSRLKPFHDIFIHEQAREMVKRGLRVQVITTHAPGDNDSPAEEILEGVPVHRIIAPDSGPAQFFPITFALRAIRKAIQLNRTGRFDIVHAQFADHAGLAGAITARILRRPFILTVHGYDIYYSQELGYGLGITRLQRIYVSLILKSAHRILTVSTAARKQCITKWHINPKKLEVIHNGIDLQKPPARDKLDRFRASLNIDGKRVILSISELLKRKGQQNIIKALPAVVKEVPDAIFVLVGDGPYLAELERLTAELGLRNHVKMTRSFVDRSAVQMFLGICDVFVLASVLECFGIVYIEALSLGKPVIGSHGEGAEDFIVDGENGFLIHPSNTDELARRITVCLKNKSLRESMGQQGKKLVTSSFLWKHNVEKLITVYQGFQRDRVGAK
jgi:teichuronic acid biosynthesis glycosyltransferase TuaC